MAVPKRSSDSSQSVSSGQRISSLPLMIVGGIIVLFAMGIMYAAGQRVPEVREFEQASVVETLSAEQEFETISFVEGQRDGMVNAVAPVEVSAALPEDDRQKRLSDQMKKMIEDQKLKEMRESQDIQDRMMKHQIDLAQQAVEGGMSVSGIGRGSPDPVTSINASSSPNNASGGRTQPGNAANFQDLVSSISGGTQGGSPGGGRSLANSAAAAQLSSTDVSGVAAAQEFTGGNYRDDFTLFERSRTPSSKYQLITGTLIPGVMISAVNSELPGDLVGQVSQDVYDSVTGQYLLIPKGSKLFGRYDAFAALGAERLLMVWDRLVMPDGETLTLGSIQGYDDRGRAGGKDRVITHFFRTLGNALLLSVATAGTEALVDSADSSSNIFSDITANFGNNTTGALDEYLRSRLRIRPTLEIRSGFRFNILVNRDITFPEPFEFGYTRTGAPQ